MEETDFYSSAYGQNGVLLIGKGVAYRKTEETDLCWSAYGRNKVLFIGRGVAYRKTGLHGLLFIYRLVPCSSLHGLLFIHRRFPPASTCYCSSTIDFLQPPPAIVHPRATVHPASTGSCSSTPTSWVCGGLLGVLFI
jgi:hypothetical protein